MSRYLTLISESPVWHRAVVTKINKLQNHRYLNHLHLPYFEQRPGAATATRIS